MHHCGWGLKPASIIIVLWYCHYSIFPPLWLPLLSPRLRKECKKLFPFKREGETDIFSQGVELEDRLTSTEGHVLTTVMIIMKSNLVQIVISGNLNFPLSLILWNVRLGIVLTFDTRSAIIFCTHWQNFMPISALLTGYYYGKTRYTSSPC